MNDLQKRIDNLHYEIGSLHEQVRNYQLIAETQKHKIDVLVNSLNVIRTVHRHAKNFEVADAIREVLEKLGFEVKDEPIKDNPPVTGKEPSEL
jgi:cysteinyl-tRNA synthetase